MEHKNNINFFESKEDYKTFMENKKHIFKNNIKFYMKKNGVTQKKLGENLGKSESTVHNWIVETNKIPMFNDIPKIAKCLGINVSDLFENRSEEDYVAISAEETLNKIEDKNRKDEFSSKLFNAIPDESKNALIEKEDSKNNLLTVKIPFTRANKLIIFSTIVFTFFALIIGIFVDDPYMVAGTLTLFFATLFLRGMSESDKKLIPLFYMFYFILILYFMKLVLDIINILVL